MQENRAGIKALFKRSLPFQLSSLVIEVSFSIFYVTEVENCKKLGGIEDRQNDCTITEAMFL